MDEGTLREADARQFTMHYDRFAALQRLLNHLRSSDNPEILADVSQLDAWCDEVSMEVIE